MKTIINFIKRIFGKRDDDPVYYCEFHKKESCPHVDGILCDMTTCDILLARKYEDMICPVCGYYCLGTGGVGCIDKPNFTD
jgi:hypothetical protein